MKWTIMDERRHETLLLSVKVEEVELLGVRVDNNLKFESQIKKICRIVSQKIAVLKKLLPLKLREKLYRAFIVPRFNYCAAS